MMDEGCRLGALYGGKSMQIQRLLLGIFSIFLGLLLVGCAKYKPHPFLEPNSKCIEKDNVKVSTVLLDEKDCKYYFDREILKHGFQPVQIYLENNSDKNFILNAADINKPIAPRAHVAKALHYNTKWYATPGIIVGTLLSAVPLGVGTYLLVDGLVHSSLAFVIGAELIIMGLFPIIIAGIPSWIVWKQAVRANKRLDQDFEKRILNNDSIVELTPNSTLNTVFFTKKENIDCFDKFVLQLYNAQESKNIEFEFDLK